jgi:tetratricopeptide (TPR) repeat protein
LSAPDDLADSDSSKGISFAKELLRERKVDVAITHLQGMLDQDPGDQEVLYVLAVCYRYNDDTQTALATLDTLLARDPDYARGYQERGHIYRKRAQAQDAVMAYERAVELNPALLVSWQNLTKLHRDCGEKERSRICEKHSDLLLRLPPELLSVTSMIHERKLYQAEQLCRAFVQKNRQHVEGMRLLAKIATELGILDDADFLLESCLEFEPNFRAARYDYAQVLFRRQRFQKSMEQAALLLKDQPAIPAFRLLFANAAVPVGEFDKALEYYDQLIEESTDNLHYHMLKGHALKSFGDRQGAVEAYQRAAAIKPDHGDAYWSLANVKTYRFKEAEIERMQRAEKNAATEAVDRYQLCFALGKSFEDNEKYETAFEYYARGNQLKLAKSRYRAERTDKEFARQQAICTRQFFDDRVGFGTQSNEPIFIVGMPRAGSTLLEQILASHPMVDGTIELPNMMSQAQKLGGRHKIDDESRYPAILETLSQKQLERFGNEYLKSTKVYRKDGNYFTDKMPNNFRHIGLIQLMFPNCKIIDARRHPMACCFSNFKQLFGDGQEFSYGLEEVGRYYSGYVELMDHWENALPGKILRVQYEDVVADLDAQVRRLLEFLGLPFDQRCIEFHKNERAVHTPSAEQVRQPVYTSGVEQWRNFDPFLGPLKDSLGFLYETDVAIKTADK